MSSANVSMILDSGLTPAEKAKFDQIEVPLVNLVVIPSGRAIRLCQGRGAGGSRRIEFLDGATQRPLIAFLASDFLAASTEDLLRRADEQLR